MVRVNTLGSGANGRARLVKGACAGCEGRRVVRGCDLAVVPQTNDTVCTAVVIAQHANAGGIEHQTATERRRVIDPPRGEYAQHMSARENEDAALERPKPRHDPIDAFGDLRHRLAAGTTVAEEFPLRTLLMDVHKRPALIITVIPLEQLAVKRCHAHKAGELTGSQRPPQRTREHVIESQALESGTDRASLLLTAARERKIGSPRVLTGDSPSGLSVSHEIDIGSSGCQESPAFAATTQEVHAWRMTRVLWQLCIFANGESRGSSY
jgi:hypothetical protein